MLVQVALPADDLADGQWSVTLLEDVLTVSHEDVAVGVFAWAMNTPRFVRPGHNVTGTPPACATGHQSVMLLLT